MAWMFQGFGGFGLSLYQIQLPMTAHSVIAIPAPIPTLCSKIFFQSGICLFPNHPVFLFLYFRRKRQWVCVSPISRRCIVAVMPYLAPLRGVHSCASSHESVDYLLCRMLGTICRGGNNRGSCVDFVCSLRAEQEVQHGWPDIVFAAMVRNL